MFPYVKYGHVGEFGFPHSLPSMQVKGGGLFAHEPMAQAEKAACLFSGLAFASKVIAFPLGLLLSLDGIIFQFIIHMEYTSHERQISPQ